MAAWKVIHLITRLDRGGSAQNTLLTALGHDRSRFEPLVVAGRAGRWDAQGGDRATEENGQLLKGAGVCLHLVPTLTRGVNPVKDLVALRQLTALLRRERPAIVHTHTSKAGALGRLAARLAGVPVVVHTPHGHVFYGHFGRLTSWAFLQVERRLAPWTTGMIALTEAEREEHLDRGIGPRGSFAVVPSGIDLERFRRGAGPRPEGFGCPPDAIVVGSVGWLTPVKGHRFLIEALARLKPTHPRLHAVIVGSGGLRDELAALAGLLDRPDWAKELGVAARRSIGERFGAQAMVRAVEAVYEEALRDAGRR